MHLQLVCVYVEGFCSMLLTLWDPGRSHSLECPRSQWLEKLETGGSCSGSYQAFAYSQLVKGRHTVAVHFRELGKIGSTWDWDPTALDYSDQLRI